MDHHRSRSQRDHASAAGGILAMAAQTEREFEFCPKCGKRVTRADAFEDEGEGEEAGRTFYYCSERCREAH